eukprot:TRINITY_DN48346_c0_g1_i1.p1 TRINITY_DN48346_c0_g1~~TRINITY_DN48346_c0_g1_i1.p1  ORF type:complete len:250 (-),score=57.57 TRINITY_DN48346_c0_g1_i1:203-952(-)
MNFRSVALLVVLLATVAHCRLTHVQGSAHTLLQYGSADSPQHFLLELDPTEKVINTVVHTSNKHIATSHQLSVERLSDTLTNVSVTHMFDGLPGDVNYALTVTTKSSSGELRRYSVERKHSVYGLVFYDEKDDSKSAVSGDFGHGLNLSPPVSDKHTIRLKYLAHVPQDVKQLQVSARVVSGAKRNSLLRNKDVGMDDDTLNIVLRPNRVGMALVGVEAENLVVDGESFETVIPVRVAHTTRRRVAGSR